MREALLCELWRGLLTLALRVLLEPHAEGREQTSTIPAMTQLDSVLADGG